MKSAFVLLITFLATVLISASPIDVYFVGNEAKMIALFREGVDNHAYNFLLVKKRDFSAPSVRESYMGSLPKELRTPKKKDKVIAALIIDQNGKVVEVEIVETSDERLNLFVKKDLEKWTYHAAKKNGQPVACCVFQPYEYKIVSIEEFGNRN